MLMSRDSAMRPFVNSPRRKRGGLYGVDTTASRPSSSASCRRSSARRYGRDCRCPGDFREGVSSSWRRRPLLTCGMGTASGIPVR